MGMFDDVLLNPGLKCKKCSSRIRYMQTKDFDNILDIYTEDKEIPHPDKDFPMKHRTFSCVGECTKCDTMHGAIGLITDNIFRGIVEYRTNG